MMLDRFFIRDQMMFCGVKVEETKGYAQIDTGASRSYIYSEYVNERKIVAKSEVKTAIGSYITGRYRASSISALGEIYLNLELTVLHTKSIQKYDKQSVIMTLGNDILYQKGLLHIDSRNNTISLGGEGFACKDKVPLFRERKSGLVFFNMRIGRKDCVLYIRYRCWLFCNQHEVI
jgi:hypothetical protein